MPIHRLSAGRRTAGLTPALALGLLALSLVPGAAQAPPAPASSTPRVPEWAYPGTPTRTQVAPPPDFRRPTTLIPTPIGIFDGQAEVGTPIVPGRASFDPATGRYTITASGYNVWYYRDEFRFLWKQMRGDVSLAADVAYPDPKGYGDRKAVLVIRQDLDDDSVQVVVAPHGAGMIQLAQRPAKGARVTDLEYRVGSRGGRPGGASPDSLVPIPARRVGLEKRGDRYALHVSLEGEPMHPIGPPVTQRIAEPFYVGIGFCSHLPDTLDTAVLSNVVLENAAGKVR